MNDFWNNEASTKWLTIYRRRAEMILIENIAFHYEVIKVHSQGSN